MATTMSELYGGPLPEHIPSLWHSFNANIAKNPDAVALVSTHQPSELFSIASAPLEDDEYLLKPYLRWTYKSLKRGVDRLSRALIAKGVKAGMPVVYLLQNNAEYVLTFWAATRLGCVLAPINPRNLSNKEEFSHMLKIVSIGTEGQRMVIVAGNEDLADQIDLLPGIELGIKIVVADSQHNGWSSFRDLVEQAADEPLDIEDVPSDMIFFTSGTTSLPKGCRWKSDQHSAFIQMRIDRNTPILVGDKFCVVVPNNHALGSISLTSTYYCGGAVVFPGAAFAAGPLVSTLHLEKITHLSMVPTMIQSVLEANSASGRKFKSIKSILLGGSLVTPAALRHCIEDLGAFGSECGYGMTEGLLIGTGNQPDPSKVIVGNDVAVGWIPRASGIKICAPGDSKPLPRGQAGELHWWGRTLVHGYIGKESSDFYTDSDGKVWFKSGDQAVLDHEDRVFIVGRYKDMIIRGAENIAPAAIEKVLSKVPRLAALQIQIVAAPDSIAGEVPVAIAHGTVDSELTREIKDTVIKQMGMIYVPDEVISLQALGLEDYPRTMAGKVQKTKVTELVRKYREEREKTETNGVNHELEDTVREMWARAIGREPNQISLDSDIAEFADSILVMRVRDRIKRATGKSLSLAEMAGAGTLAGQIKLLAAAPFAETNGLEPQQQIHREGPPGVEDMVHLVEDPDLFDATKDVIEKAIAPYGLDWHDVDDCMPVYDFAASMVKTGVFDTWNFKISWMPKSKVNFTELRTALEMVLKNNPIFASFLVWNEEALESDVTLHVTIKHDRKYLDQIIEDGGTLEKIKDLEDLTVNYPKPEHGQYPGPLYRATIYYVKEIESCAVLYRVSHAVIDASYSQIVSEDIDNALAGRTHLHTHTPYKLWADSYHSLRSSPAANASIKWHVKRLKDLATHRKAIFPPESDWTAWDTTKEVPEVTEATGGFMYDFEATNLPNLRKQHGNISAAVTLKSAQALMNIHRTGYTHALFSNLEAGRTSFPFVPKSLEAQFQASDVAGPTIQGVINLIEIPITPSETVLDFLQRMQTDQIALTKHASAPFHKIMSALGPSGELLPKMVRIQGFNWIPQAFSADPFENYKGVKTFVGPSMGLSVNGGTGGKEGCTVFMRLSGQGVGLEGVGRDIEKIFLWLVDEANWGREVRDFVECFGSS